MSTVRSAVARHPSTELVLGLTLLVGAVAVGTTASRPAAGAAVAATRPAGPPPHLVGHEDAALLARVQANLDEFDPRRLENPYLKQVPAVVDGKLATRLVLRRPDLAEFVADPEAAVALGKAFFWEMQAGSDFARRTAPDGKTRWYGTACASCHYRNGIDARDRNTTRVPYVAWDAYDLDDKYPPRPEGAAGEPAFAEGEFKQWAHTPNAAAAADVNKGVALVVGSQGVRPRIFGSLNGAAPAGGGDWDSERFFERDRAAYAFAPEWSMFLTNPGKGGTSLRQITNRNSQPIANAVFSDRQFHDGRAESTFNGFSIFGDHDRRQVLFKRNAAGQADPVHVAIPQAGLASQAVGPIVNEVEMSYLGRTFPDLARKLLPRKWLEFQAVDADDSVLAADWLYAGPARADRVTYADLIRRAFRREWWEDLARPGGVKLNLKDPELADGAANGPLVEANFSLYWGLSIMLYESTLISDRTPYDAMLRGDGRPVNDRWDADFARRLGPVLAADIGPAPTTGAAGPTTAATRPQLELRTGTAVFQLGLRTFLNRGCVECHSGLLFSEVFEPPALNEAEPQPPVADRVARTLLPNAQADAIAVNIAGYRERVGRIVSDELAALGAPPADRPALLLTLWRSLAEARGDDARLQTVVGRELTALVPPPPDNAVKRISNRLMEFEKGFVRAAGGRTFFTEDERVAAAELMVGDLLVERMLVPPTQRMMPGPLARPVVRPPLPIAGPLATDAYAFYDAGYYALGVAPPRFDRGIGAVSGDEEEELAVEIAFARAKERGANPPAVSQTVQPGAKVRGTAYTFRRAWKSPPAAPAAQPPPRGLAPRVGKPRDTSWSRNEVPPDSGLADLEFDRRRSDMHFFARARRLAADEEATGHRKPFLHDNELAFWGAFKTPSLRNVELTAPYMHNGRLFSLADVIDFYDAGGTLWQRPDGNPDKHPAMVPLGLTPSEKKALHFFLACLTDPRVRREQAPFDHPSLIVVNGYEDAAAGAVGPERLLDVKPTGRGGLSPVDVPPVPVFPPATRPATAPATGPTTYP